MNWKIAPVILICMIILDYLWLGLISKNLYLEQVGKIARLSDGKMDPILWPAGVVYILLALGTVVFVLPQWGSDVAWWQTALAGAFFGLVIYGVYDMTNHALLKDWPLPISLIDMAWGTFLCGASAMIGRAADSYFPV